MKLRNKKTGEIGELNYCGGYIQVIGISINTVTGDYTSLAELTEDWEDYEELDECWYMDWQGKVRSADAVDNDWTKEKEIGNYFETKEEAEKAVEKLKAWERLKEKGFKFTDWYRDVCEVSIQAEIHDEGTMGMINDLDICFGGEE